MKKIAQAVGIAVGTLYNYFPGKKELFNEILLESWETTLSKVEKIFTEPYEIHQLHHAIEVIYSDIEMRKGLGKHFISMEHVRLGDEDDVYMRLFASLENKIYEVMKALDIEFPKRKARMLIISVITMKNDFDSEKDENLRYLFDLVKES